MTVAIEQTAAALDTMRSKRIAINRQLDDPRWMTFSEATTGSSTYLIGSRSDTGAVTSLDAIQEVQRDGQAVTTRFLNATDRRVEVGERFVFNFIRRPDGRVDMTVTDNETGRQGTATDIPAEPAIRSTPSSAEAPVSPISTSFPLVSKAAPGTVTTLPVNVRTLNCGVQGDPQSRVRVMVRSSSGSSLGTLPTTRTGSGSFTAQVPIQARDAALDLRDIKQALDYGVQALDTYCLADQQVPFASERVCIAAFLAPLVGEVAGPACIVAVAAARASCRIRAYMQVEWPGSSDLMTDLALQQNDRINNGITNATTDLIPDEAFNNTLSTVIESLPPVEGQRVAMRRGAQSFDVTVDDRTVCQQRYEGDVTLTGPANSGGTSCPGTYTVRGRVTVIYDPLSPAATRLNLLGNEQIAQSCFNQTNPANIGTSLVQNGITLFGTGGYDFNCPGPCVRGRAEISAQLTLGGGGIARTLTGSMRMTNTNQSGFRGTAEQQQVRLDLVTP